MPVEVGTIFNPDFNRVQFEAVRSEAGLNRFVMTPTKWIEQTNAIGIVSKAGRYGGGTVKCRMRVPFVTQESLFVNENLIL